MNSVMNSINQVMTTSPDNHLAGGDYELLVWTPEMVKAFWDYEANFPAQFFTRTRRYQIISDIGRYLPRNCAVLDYGCGPGNLIGPLLDAGFSVAGMDASSSARARVQAEYGDHPRFLGVYDQQGLDSSSLTFDAIVVAEVIEHLYDEQLDSLLETLRKLCGADTHIIFTTPNEEDLQESYILCPVSGKLFHRWQHVRSWSADSITSYLRARGFGATRAFTTDFDVTLAIRGKHHPLRGRWWSALRRTIRYRTQPRRKRPHLVIITQLSGKA
jgi:2-polyprenyl-3-methyl-5-hydroxy-6-metoxy-1,4-benzoquinol methylase